MGTFAWIPPFACGHRSPSRTQYSAIGLDRDLALHDAINTMQSAARMVSDDPDVVSPHDSPFLVTLP